MTNQEIKMAAIQRSGEKMTTIPMNKTNSQLPKSKNKANRETRIYKFNIRRSKSEKLKAFKQIFRALVVSSLVSSLIAACTVEPRERITSESARIDAIKLLEDLKLEYKGIHCGEPRKALRDNHDYVVCDVSSKPENMKVECKLHDCKLIEKNALRIKFGISK